MRRQYEEQNDVVISLILYSRYPLLDWLLDSGHEPKATDGVKRNKSPRSACDDSPLFERFNTAAFDFDSEPDFDFDLNVYVYVNQFAENEN